MGLQRLMHVVHEVDVRGIIEVAGVQQLLDMDVASSVRATVLVFSSMV